MKIGVFGGTFNPIHNAHIKLATIFRVRLELDLCLIVPAAVSPFKIEDESVKSSSSLDRLTMTKLATEGIDNVEVEEYEINSTEISYTYKTLDYISKKYATNSVYFLIGTDQAVKFNHWKNWDYIGDNYTACIALRPEHNSQSVHIEVENIWRNAKYKPIWLNAPIINISSTMLRERVKSSNPIFEFVNSKVEAYIKDNKLYL